MTDTKRKDVLEGLDGYTPGPWEWVGSSIETPHHGPPSYGEVMEITVECGPYCNGGMPVLSLLNPDRALIARAPELVEEVRVLREAVRELDRGAACLTDAVVAEPPTDVPVRYMGERVIIHRATFDALRALLPDTGEE